MCSLAVELWCEAKILPTALLMPPIKLNVGYYIEYYMWVILYNVDLLPLMKLMKVDAWEGNVAV